MKFKSVTLDELEKFKLLEKEKWTLRFFREKVNELEGCYYSEGELLMKRVWMRNLVYGSFVWDTVWRAREEVTDFYLEEPSNFTSYCERFSK